MNFNHDLAIAREELREIVKELHANKTKPDTETRINEVKKLTEDYTKATGERPEDYMLTKLSDYILVEDLTNQYKHAKNRESANILTESQMKKQKQRHPEVPYNENYGV